MNGNDFKENLYASLTEEFMSNIQDDNLDEIHETRESTIEAYNTYLHKRYDRLFEKVEEMFDEVDENKYNKVASICEDSERIRHFEYDGEGRLAWIFPDENFIELENISFEIAGLARTKKETGKTPPMDKSKEEYAEQMKSLAESVRPAFKWSAERLLSEGLVDLVYLFDNDNIQSFRTSHI